MAEGLGKGVRRDGKGYGGKGRGREVREGQEGTGRGKGSEEGRRGMAP